MPRKYVRKIRFYESWFADLNDPDKEFTAAEKWAVVMAIVQSQHDQSTAPMDDLPKEIRRALQMPTLKEQLSCIIDKSAAARDKGSIGGRTTASGGRNEDTERARSASEDRAERHKAALPSGYNNLSFMRLCKQRENEGDRWAIYLRGGDPGRCDFTAPEYRNELLSRAATGDPIAQYICKYCNINVD